MCDVTDCIYYNAITRKVVDIDSKYGIQQIKEIEYEESELFPYGCFMMYLSIVKDFKKAHEILENQFLFAWNAKEKVSKVFFLTSTLFLLKLL